MWHEAHEEVCDFEKRALANRCRPRRSSSVMPSKPSVNGMFAATTKLPPAGRPAASIAVTLLSMRS